jgi:hypothetical protein
MLYRLLTQAPLCPLKRGNSKNSKPLEFRIKTYQVVSGLSPTSRCNRGETRMEIIENMDTIYGMDAFCRNFESVGWGFECLRHPGAPKSSPIFREASCTLAQQPLNFTNIHIIHFPRSSAS